MNEAGLAEPMANSSRFRVSGDDGVRECAGLSETNGRARLPGGLLDHDDVFGFEDHTKCEVRLGLYDIGFLDLDGHFGAAGGTVSLPGDPSVDENAVSLEKLPSAPAPDMWQPPSDDSIDTLAGLVFVDPKTDHYQAP
jgi:hypothetical protein